MATARYEHTATLLPGGNVLIAGGMNWDNGPFDSAELYDPKTGAFSPTASMSTKRLGQTATLLEDGRVLVAGGADGNHTLASAELYDPKTGAFSPTGSMLASRQLHTAVLLKDGRVLIVGGQGDGYFNYRRTAELYDPNTGEFRPATSSITNVGAVLLLPNEQVAVFGDSSVQLYDPQSGTVQSRPLRGTITGTPTVLANGRILFAGGADASGDVLASAQIYDLDTGAVTPTGSMTTPRGGSLTILLRDERVLVAGGYGNCSASKCDFLYSAEIYDPSTGKFSNAGSMTSYRDESTITLLSDGRVLIAGGRYVVASAELFEP
jgi:hypothetical protein